MLVTPLRIDPAFLTTRETFPGEKSFGELSAQFFAEDSAEQRARLIARLYAGNGVLVHMANPEQIDDLFAHIDRETQVRYLSASYLHRDIRTTVYAIGRGTGLLLDSTTPGIEHISVNDSNTVTDPRGNLVADNRARVESLDELREALLRDRATSFANDVARDEWNEVNVSFSGPAPILGFFALDGILSKLYGAMLYLKAGRLLPLFTYNRASMRFLEFRPSLESIAELIEDVPPRSLQNHFRNLLGLL